MGLLDWVGIDSKKSRRKKETLEQNLAEFSVLTMQYATLRKIILKSDHVLRAKGRFSGNGYSDSVDEKIVSIITSRVRELRSMLNEQDSLVKIMEEKVRSPDFSDVVRVRVTQVRQQLEHTKEELATLERDY